ncbi:glutathione synthase [Shewanella atlantica]|uniref:glutathione synthase n=1 Tax=Shewanella atlantica TaxID=271099 RepID=UPI003734D8B4
MVDIKTKHVAEAAVEWALLQGLSLKATPDSARHAPFSMTPSVISRDRFERLKKTVPLMGKLIHSISEDREFLSRAIEPVAKGEPFFAALLAMHRQLRKAPRLPLLIMRSDFMDDARHGPKLVEFNGIAAGMGPFGQKTHELHRYLKESYKDEYSRWSNAHEGALIDNPAIERLAQGIAKASMKIRAEFEGGGPATFLMVVQANEDNIFDQHLLELALQSKGIRTIRRTFRELHGQLSSGPENRLLLAGEGPIDCVYLRAGYDYCDYAAYDIIGQACCEALTRTRVLIEQHRVAVNATVGQQLASSKRVQMLLTAMTPTQLSRFDLTLDEAKAVKSLLGEMLAIDENSSGWMSKQPSENWVLKNQGEGGGHCIFAEKILPKLRSLKPEEYQVWSLMRRLHPYPASTPALLVRKGELSVVDNLICEIGIFTLHIDGQPFTEEQGYAGYLIRSKSATTTEGGVHSGMGVLDSLAYLNQ